jgi:hypothetical protein
MQRRRQKYAETEDASKYYFISMTSISKMSCFYAILPYKKSECQNVKMLVPHWDHNLTKYVVDNGHGGQYVNLHRMF